MKKPLFGNVPRGIQCVTAVTGVNTHLNEYLLGMNLVFNGVYLREDRYPVFLSPPAIKGATIQRLNLIIQVNPNMQLQNQITLDPNEKYSVRQGTISTSEHYLDNKNIFILNAGNPAESLGVIYINLLPPDQTTNSRYAAQLLTNTDVWLFMAALTRIYEFGWFETEREES